MSDRCRNARVTDEAVSAGSQTVHNRNLQDNAQSTLVHSVICLTRGPTPLPKPFLHIE